MSTTTVIINGTEHEIPTFAVQNAINKLGAVVKE